MTDKQLSAEELELLGQLVSLAAITDEATAKGIAEKLDAALARHPQPECGEVDTGLNFAVWLTTQSDFKLTADRVDAAKSAWDYLLPVIAQMDANHSALQHEADEDKRLLAERDAEIAELRHRLEAAGEWASMASIQLDERDQLRARVGELSDLLSWLRGSIGCNPQNDIDKMGAWISTNHPMIQRIDAALNAKPAGEVES